MFEAMVCVYGTYTDAADALLRELVGVSRAQDVNVLGDGTRIELDIRSNEFFIELQGADKEGWAVKIHDTLAKILPYRMRAFDGFEEPLAERPAIKAAS